MYDLKSDKPLVVISEVVMLKLSFLTCLLDARRKAMKETWGFTSTETVKAYQGRGSWGVGNFFYLTPTCYTVTTRTTLH